MEDKIDEINKDLWEVVKYFFLNIKEGFRPLKLKQRANLPE